MSNGEEKKVMDEWMKLQQKMSEQWKELMQEYNNTKVMELFGDDCKEAWNSCAKMQEGLFSMWQESIWSKNCLQ